MRVAVESLESIGASIEARPGRFCPLSYQYGPAVFRRAPDLATEVLYVVGGLYGNPFALDALLERVALETRPTRVVFNGDFHWFDIDPVDFAAINRIVLRHDALRGNVETELASAQTGAGCGCGYPEWVSDADVARSNTIITLLGQTAALDPAACAALARLPMHKVVQVGPLRVGVVHGDCWSLAGWGFAQESFAERASIIATAFAAAGVDAFASSHTCLPVAATFNTGRHALINNGATGMPNFKGTQFGLVTRIGATAAADALYRCSIEGVSIEALPIHYRSGAWHAHFAERWPAGSPASDSYQKRITQGPTYEIGQALRGGFTRVA